MVQGPIAKMRYTAAEQLQIHWVCSGQAVIAMHELIGKKIRLSWQGQIICTHCKAVTKKSFGQGYCYRCFRQLAACDYCIMAPQNCHFAKGTCREPEWGLAHCFQPHIVYLANTTGLKVGITRATQIPTRWLDQGAAEALPIIAVSSRLQSGLIEVLFKNHVADRSNWRKLLQGEVQHLHLKEEAERLLAVVKEELCVLMEKYPGEIEILAAESRQFHYPVEHFLDKAKTLNIEKTPDFTGILRGIKGQYLIFDEVACNVRKYSSYVLTLDC
jgi:hypothetical protein